MQRPGHSTVHVHVHIARALSKGILTQHYKLYLVFYIKLHVYLVFLCLHKGGCKCNSYKCTSNGVLYSCYSILTPADWRNQCWLALLVSAVIFCVIGVALWITVGVIVSNLPNGSK